MPVTSTTLLRRWCSGPGSPRAVARTGALLGLLIAFAVFLFPLAAVALPVDGNITGKVTNSGGVGIEDVSVTAYEYSDGDWNWYQEASTDSLGNYDMAELPTGTYYLEFYDYTDTYLTEYYNNVDTLEAATGVPVTAGSTTANINAQLVVGGHITGKVTDPGGIGIADAYVTAYALIDGDWNSVRDAYSDSLGNYDIGGLSARTYRLEFSDDSGVYLSEYYNNAATLDTATGVPVTAGSTTANINAQLASAGHITGKVTNPGGAGIAGVSVAVYSLQEGYWDCSRAPERIRLATTTPVVFRPGRTDWSSVTKAAGT